MFLGPPEQLTDQTRVDNVTHTHYVLSGGRVDGYRHSLGLDKHVVRTYVLYSLVYLGRRAEGIRVFKRI